MKLRLLKKYIIFSLISLIFFIASLIIPSPTHAITIDCSSGFTPLSDGITHKQFTKNNPRKMAIYITKVDLNFPGIGLYVTPREYLGSRTSRFLDTFDLELAINANEHNSFSSIKGLAASSGDIYGNILAAGSLYISQSNQYHMNKVGYYPPEIWHAVSGSHDLLMNGATNPRIDNCVEPTHCAHKQPRTAVGLTSDNQLIIINVDGRQSHSIGATLPDLVDMFKTCNAHSAINLDGGGSSTLVSKTRGIMNKFSDTTERVVANHLGVCLNNCDNLIPRFAAPTSTTNGGFSPSAYTPPTVSTKPQVPHPLRPKPNILTAEERSHSINEPEYTPYCAQRPTVVKNQRYLKNESIPCNTNGADISGTNCIAATFQGTLNQNFEAFNTPFLSITDIDQEKEYKLSYNEKAQRYLADFLEGRAFYEPEPEPATPDFSQMFQSLGIFRELAPPEYQHKLKRAMIYRATDPSGYESNIIKLYGFRPFTLSLHNYIVACWNGSKPTKINYKNKANPCGGSREVKLSHFFDNWHPIYNLDGFASNKEYKEALEDWEQKDNGKWNALWNYVPMFTREDSKAKIISAPEEGQQYDEVLDVTVAVPHLARTAEVSTALSHLLTPPETHQVEDPDLPTKWAPAPFNPYNWWLESEIMGGDQGGPVCEPQPPNKTLTSPGDSSYDKLIQTNVNIPASDKRAIVPHPNYNPSCVIRDPLTGDYDYSQCDATIDVRYSPNYLYTFTPHLDTIMEKLVTGPGALFKTFGVNQDQEKPKNWPAYGMPLNYSYTEGSAFAGFVGTPQGKYYFKYLGYVHCLQDRVLERLQPFVTGKEYQYFSPECDPNPKSTDVCTNNCNNDPSSVSLVGVKERFIIMANAWFLEGTGFPRLDKFDQVVSTAQANGVDPIFALAKWLHETGASNYYGICQMYGGDPLLEACKSTIDFGILDESIRTRYDASGTILVDHFDDQLNAFMHLPLWYLQRCAPELADGTAQCEMEIWQSMFGDGSCEPSAHTNATASKVLYIYQQLTPGITQPPCYPIALP